MARAPAIPPEMTPVGRAAIPLDEADEAEALAAVAEAEALDEADESLLEAEAVKLLAIDEAATTMDDALLSAELTIEAADGVAWAAAKEVMKYCWTALGRPANQAAVVGPDTSEIMALSAAGYKRVRRL
jgi:hypothetical protein